MSTDSVHEKDGEWYFWAEDWATEYGPFDTEESARAKLREYVESLE